MQVAQRAKAVLHNHDNSAGIVGKDGGVVQQAAGVALRDDGTRKAEDHGAMQRWKRGVTARLAWGSVLACENGPA